jgi:hypothetical protein
VGHVACVGDTKFVQNFGQKSEEKRLLGRPRRRLLTGFIWLMIVNSMGSYKHCNESSGSVTVEDSLD